MTYSTDRQLSLCTRAGARRMAFCQRISATVMNGEDDDPTGRALYYAYLRLMDPGGWFEKNFVHTPDEHPDVATLGHHVFYA
jgi:hypothetical protein